MTVTLQALVEKLEQNFRSENQKGFRARAWERFCEIEWTHEKAEHFRRFPLRKIYEENFKLPVQKRIASQEWASEIIPESGEDNLILFVDGVFQKEYSKAPVKLLTLSEAEEKFALFLNHRLLILLQQESDPFSLLNMALSQEGLFLYLPPDTHLEKPLQIHHHITSEESLISPRIHLLVGKNSDATCSLTQSSASSHSWVNGGVDILMDEKSSLKMVFMGEKKGALLHTTTTYAHLKKNSRLEMVQVGGGAEGGKRSVRHHFHASLAASSHFALSGINFLKGREQSHIHTHIEHQGEGAYSLQKFKTILQEQSLANFDGKIYIKKEAMQSQAYQLNNSLLLSDHARVYSQPRLEIFADDVKASHGATVGKIDPEELFYLLSRGIPLEAAKALLMEGFAKEVLDLIPIPSLRNKYLNCFK